MSIHHINSRIKLNNGIMMPLLGIGVFLMEEGDEVKNAVKYALEIGYRSIDTAAIYRNEIGVGNAIKESEVSRSEIFLTSKVWNADQGYDSTLKAFDATLRRLKTDYLDLYLIHWPVRNKYIETYKALEKLYNQGRIKAIGVSNFALNHFAELLENCKVKPMVNQVEFHPLLQQPDLHNFCNLNNIQLEAWGPLMQGKIFNVKELQPLAKKYNKTIAQIALRWEIQKQVVVIPKSINHERIVENANIFDFELENDDIKFIDKLDRDKRIGPDPNNFNF